MDKAVAFIPARKGSKGIPGKNMKLFKGKPLIQWSIEQAKDSKLFDRIVVSSDDEKVLALAKELDVEAVERQPNLCTDEMSLDIVLFDYFVREENRCEYISLLQPTSPLRSIKDLKEGFRFIKMKKNHSVVGVTWNGIMGWVEKVAKIGTTQTAFCLYQLHQRPNRQNRDDWSLENGAIYWMNRDTLLDTGNRVGDPMHVKLYYMPLERSLEVDTLFDWYMAEAAYDYVA